MKKWLSKKVLQECSGDLYLVANEHAKGRNAAKVRETGVFLHSTAGGRELGLKARPPARLVGWRTPSTIRNNGLLPVV
jgi:hypothetical protein